MAHLFLRSAIEIEQMADVGLMDLLMVPAIDKFHLNELQRVCKLSSDPITRLVSIIDTEEDLTRLSERWRLTNDERDYGLWLIANRSSPRTLEAAQDILVESVPGISIILSPSIGSMLIMNQSDFVYLPLYTFYSLLFSSLSLLLSFIFAPCERSTNHGFLRHF